MTVYELCESCMNTGNGTIKIINNNNNEDTAEFESIQQLEKTPIRNFKVLTWELFPKKQISACDWEFSLVIVVD